ncbi:MAG: flap endonuclease-1 [Halobacteriaceae archaeon]
MGNADLRDIAAIEAVSVDDLGGGVVAVDAHNWLYRYLTTTVRFTADEVYTTADGEEVANLVGIVQGLPKLLEADLTPVFVFDGGVTDLKAAEIEARREQREQYEADLAEAREADADAAEIATLESRTQRLTDTILETSRELLGLLDVPVVDAPAEGEAQAAHMARDGPADYAGSEDYDTLLFGAPVTLRRLTAGDPERMELAATLDRHDITREQLIDAAILVGTDFNEGVTGYGPKTAVSAVREHGDLWGVFEAEDVYVEGADRVRELYRDPPVTGEYDIDLDLAPDLGAARKYVAGWEIPAGEVERGFERIEDAVAQTGLDRFT